MGDTRLVFAGIHAHLEKYAKDNSFAQREVAASISCKIEEYWAIMDSASTTSAILAPVKKTRQYFANLRQNMELANENSTPELETETELDRYLELPIDDEAEPLLWWQAHACEFPVLSSMARDYLTIQATSVASEHAFSVAGNTITKTRNRLLAETARACLCVKSWIDNDLVK
jgi:hypothetical protein